jgi:hypothetical protein
MNYFCNDKTAKGCDKSWFEIILIDNLYLFLIFFLWKCSCHKVMLPLEILIDWLMITANISSISAILWCVVWDKVCDKPKTKNIQNICVFLLDIMTVMVGTEYKNYLF